MSAESKSFPEVLPFPSARRKSAQDVRRRALWLQVATVYSAILIACWTPEGPPKAGLMLLTTCAIAILTLSSRYTAKEMGLGKPPLPGSLLILACGSMFALSLPLIASVAGLQPPRRILDRAPVCHYSPAKSRADGCHSRGRAFLLRDVSPLPNDYSPGSRACVAGPDHRRQLLRSSAASHARRHRISGLPSLTREQSGNMTPWVTVGNCILRQNSVENRSRRKRRFQYRAPLRGTAF